MGILCVFCVYDTIGNRCFEKTSFPIIIIIIIIIMSIIIIKIIIVIFKIKNKLKQLVIK